MNHRLPFIVLLLAATAHADECASINSGKIHMADLAKIRSEFAELNPDIVIGYAPVPGAQRIFSPSQLRRLMERHAMGQPAGPTGHLDWEAACFVRETRELSEAVVIAALKRAIGDPDARIEVLDYYRQPVPVGELEFDLSGFHPPRDGPADTPFIWRGRVLYGDRRSMPVWARFRASVARTQVVALRELKVGEAIDDSDLAERSGNVLPGTKESLRTVDDVVGTRPRRTIPAGEPIHAGDLVQPFAVERGQRVAVVVESGAATLRFESTAEASGHAGETIPIANPLNGKRFDAKVSGDGRVVVRAGEVER